METQAGIWFRNLIKNLAEENHKKKAAYWANRRAAKRSCQTCAVRDTSLCPYLHSASRMALCPKYADNENQLL